MHLNKRSKWTPLIGTVLISEENDFWSVARSGAAESAAEDGDLIVPLAIFDERNFSISEPWGSYGLPPEEKLLENENADFPVDDLLSFPLKGFAGMDPSKERPLLAFDVDKSFAFDVSVDDVLDDDVFVVEDDEFVVLVVCDVEDEAPTPESNEEKSNFNPDDLLSVLIWLGWGTPKRMENDFVEDVIRQGYQILNEEKYEIEVDLISKMIDDINVPTVDYQSLSSLGALCLFVEDLLNKNEEALSKAQVRNICRDLHEKVNNYKQFYKTYKKLSDSILTVAQWKRYVTKLDESICKLEEVFY